jgi:hypothetical protein
VKVGGWFERSVTTVNVRDADSVGEPESVT